MKTANFLLCLVAIVISSVIAAPEGDGRIVNGRAIRNQDAPYIVYLSFKDRTYCSGSVLSPWLVVTAGHCVDGKSADDITVIANITSIYEEGIRRKVRDVDIHNEYTVFAHDIAMLILAEPLVDITPIEVCDKPLEAGQEVQVSGWGRTAEDKPGSSILQTIFTPVRAKKDCFSDEDTVFCASGLSNQSACKGDSGGPAVFNNKLCGIVSFGVRCGMVGYPTGYADVYALKSFIQDYTGH